MKSCLKHTFNRYLSQIDYIDCEKMATGGNQQSNISQTVNQANTQTFTVYSFNYSTNWC